MIGQLKLRVHERTCIIVSHCNGVPIETATAWYLSVAEALVAVTNTHVLETVHHMRTFGDPAAWYELSAGAGRQAVQIRGGYMLMPHDSTHQSSVPSKYGLLDFALLKVPDNARGYVLGGKKAFTLSDIDESGPDVGRLMFWLGYPNDSVAASPPDIMTPYLEGESKLFATRVVRVEDRLLVLRGLKSYGYGHAELIGVSGSAVLDAGGCVRAVLWGGSDDLNEIYACPIRHVVQELPRILEAGRNDAPT
ncbi:MAG TPA: hypothetical protein VGZ02_17610 [Candidatus Baltobacteraceae bacterium]|jgi:hypothetical protein|nr:hypothetical protein [Candidatus Baltobacteraceae bacterium]